MKQIFLSKIYGNERSKTIVKITLGIFLLLLLNVCGFFIGEENLGIHLEEKNQAPSFTHLFGTDWLGRDMFFRTLKGLTFSFWIGIIGALLSTIIAVFLSLLSSWNKALDRIVTWLIDLFLSMPHIVTLLLISFVLGGGAKGVVVGIAFTHWPSLTRLLRGKIISLKSAPYIGISKQLGKTRWWIAKNHYLPHLIPHIIVGFILLFPHAILHEAAITFLGFGLSPETPAIGIILSESMRYLSTGMWWLAFFPGLSLVFMVGIFDMIGTNVRKFADPFHGQK